MIQRIQSLYLFLTTIVSGLFLKGSFLSFINYNGSESFMRFTGIYRSTGETVSELIGRMVPVTVISLLIPLISFLAIFFFKKRSLQMKITLVLLILEVLLIITGSFYTIELVKSNSFSVIPELNTFFPFLEIIFTFLAYIGIRKDEMLIKSYDRLR